MCLLLKVVIFHASFQGCKNSWSVAEKNSSCRNLIRFLDLLLRQSSLKTTRWSTYKNGTQMVRCFSHKKRNPERKHTTKLTWHTPIIPWVQMKKIKPSFLASMWIFQDVTNRWKLHPWSMTIFGVKKPSLHFLLYLALQIHQSTPSTHLPMHLGAGNVSQNVHCKIGQVWTKTGWVVFSHPPKKLGSSRKEIQRPQKPDAFPCSSLFHLKTWKSWLT